MTSSSRIRLRARVVLPVAGPPLDDGALLLENDRIASVGPWKTLRQEQAEQTVDLGEVLLMPGLINAHCHLDYTAMAGFLPRPKSFSDWIKGMLALKAHWTYSDYAASWIEGARMLLKHGTTTVADIEAVPELLPEVRSATPLRVCSLLEMTGVRSRRSPTEILQSTLDKISTLPRPGSWAGLSPHAPYSTTPELLRLSAAAARERGYLVATHIAESIEEFNMYTRASGPMFDWLQSQRDMSDCGRGSPIHYLHRQGLLGENLLAVHVNYLAPGDAELLAKSKTSVVHCPRSHAYFGHAPFPRQELNAAGVNICLATDSLASVSSTSRHKPQLDLFAEMRAMAKREPGLSSDRIVAAATVNGARALRRANELGELSSGALADLVLIPTRSDARRAYDAVVSHVGPVAGVMIGGRWVLQP